MNMPARINMVGLRHGMDVGDMDVLLAASPENFFYIANSLNLSQKIIPDRLSIALLPRDGAPAIVTCYCEEFQIRQDSWIADISIYMEFQETPIQTLASLLNERGFGSARIGIEKNFLAAVYVEELSALMPKATLVGADRIFEEARAIKTGVEIEILSQAAILTEKAILDTFQQAKVGDTEKMVADEMSRRVLGARATSFWIVLAAGANTAINHPYAGSKRFEKGEIMRVDIGGVFNGYQSDVARTAAIGVSTEAQESVYKGLREIQRETIDAARPGVKAGDLYTLCKRAFEKRGMSITSQAVGHGLGVGLHEFPVLHANETTELKPGMVLNIEPAVKDGQGFLYHIEDLLVVTDGEPKILTNVMDTGDLFVIH